MTLKSDQEASIAKVQMVFATFNDSVKERNGLVCVA